MYPTFLRWTDSWIFFGNFENSISVDRWPRYFFSHRPYIYDCSVRHQSIMLVLLLVCFANILVLWKQKRKCAGVMQLKQGKSNQTQIKSQTTIKRCDNFFHGLLCSHKFSQPTGAAFVFIFKLNWYPYCRGLNDSRFPWISLSIPTAGFIRRESCYLSELWTKKNYK